MSKNEIMDHNLNGDNMEKYPNEEITKTGNEYLSLLLKENVIPEDSEANNLQYILEEPYIKALGHMAKMNEMSPKDYLINIIYGDLEANISVSAENLRECKDEPQRKALLRENMNRYAEIRDMLHSYEYYLEKDRLLSR